ncbi:pyrroline-5-carboxylate reductase [Jimgerdemannia flammicorona]|uniref:Pyrroline-5-carboxylate reductase n=1 Tax=Jimgerdemannia flammicorona TaxID=994334 RepID=A0A433QL27_9FUNG|nr:pyrroline-5-carboxylate reductase [Jimgerdemannia flammicorona]
MSSKKLTLCVLGCGTMGVAILQGIQDTLDKTATDGDYAQATGYPHAFIATCSQEESQVKLNRIFEGRADTVVMCGENAEAVGKADVVLLWTGCGNFYVSPYLIYLCPISSTKPQAAKSILDDKDVYLALTDKCMVSICAGVTISQLQGWVPASTTVIRAMPNTPCMIREGMTVLSCPPKTSPDYKTFASNVFSTLGRCRFLEEKHLDAVTALSGSGPAFACVILEALADGGVMMGLSRDVATELAAQVLRGAAGMVLNTGMHPAAVKDGVTTPGGCTIAGLLTMEDGKIRSTLARTVQEATRVASTLGKEPAK